MLTLGKMAANLGAGWAWPFVECPLSDQRRIGEWFLRVMAMGLGSFKEVMPMLILVQWCLERTHLEILRVCVACSGLLIECGRQPKLGMWFASLRAKGCQVGLLAIDHQLVLGSPTNLRPPSRSTNEDHHQMTIKSFEDQVQLLSKYHPPRPQCEITIKDPYLEIPCRLFSTKTTRQRPLVGHLQRLCVYS